MIYKQVSLLKKGTITHKISFNYPLKLLSLFSVMFFLLPFISASPQINFEEPTPLNNSIVSTESVEINISVKDPNLSKFIWDWNGINHSLYDDSVILMMNFDNVSKLGENDTHVVDISGYGNNASCTDSTCPTWDESGRYSGAFSYDGNDDNFIIEDDDTLETSGEFTICFWLYHRTPDVTEYNRIISRWNDNTNEKAWQIWIDGGGSWVGEEEIALQQSGSIIDTNFNPPEFEWVHFCWRHSASYNSEDVYVNGSLQNSQGYTGDISNKNVNLSIGSQTDEKRYTDMKLDELIVFNRSLSHEEIQELYMSSLRKYDSDKWEFYVDKTGLNEGSYEFQAFAKNDIASSNKTERRRILAKTWWNKSWRARKKIVIDHNKVMGNLTDFPVYVDMADLGTEFFNYTDNCGDVRVTTANASEVPREIVNCNTTNRSGQLHFKAPHLYNNTNSAFYIYYNNSAASDYNESSAYGSENVYNSNIKASYNLEGDGIDSTSNNNDGSMSGPVGSTGVLGDSLFFDGSSDSVLLPPLFDGVSQTGISFWAKNPNGEYILDGSGTTNNIRVIMGNDTEFRLKYCSDNGWDDNCHVSVQTFETVDVNDWTHVFITYDNQFANTYINGRLINSSDQGSHTSTSPGDGVRMGSDLWGSGSEHSPYYKGKIDMMRIYNNAPSESWVLTLFNNQNSTEKFYNVSIMEEIKSNGESCSNNFECFSGNCYKDDDGDRYDNGINKVCNADPMLGEYGADCNDSNAFQNPGMLENCTNGIDDDCNGKIDEADIFCNDPPSSPKNIFPVNESIYDLSPKLKVNVSDPDDVYLDVCFFDESNDTLGCEQNVPNGTLTQFGWNNLSSSHNYNWFVSISDNVTTIQSNNFSFSTGPLFFNLSNLTINNGESLNYTVDVMNRSKISCFEINDTSNFNISCAGHLTNATNLKTGKYWLNITINDTIGNNNSAVIYIKNEDNEGGEDETNEELDSGYSSSGGSFFVSNTDKDKEEVSIIKPQNLEVKVDNVTNITNANLSGTNTVDIFPVSSNSSVMEFEHNFSKEILNLSNLSINYKFDRNLSFVKVKGLDNTELRKKIRIKVVLDSDILCVKDSPITSKNNISKDCNGSNERIINCTNVSERYTCVKGDGYYTVGNLSHSAVYEMPLSHSSAKGKNGRNDLNYSSYNNKNKKIDEQNPSDTSNNLKKEKTFNLTLFLSIGTFIIFLLISFIFYAKSKYEKRITVNKEKRTRDYEQLKKYVNRYKPFYSKRDLKHIIKKAGWPKEHITQVFNQEFSEKNN